MKHEQSNRRRPIATVIAALAMTLVAPDGNASPKQPGVTDYLHNVQEQQAAVVKTQKLLADKLALREAEAKSRVRALYKLSRASFPRLWLESKERERVARWLGASRRITLRDRRELALLRDEISEAAAAAGRLIYASNKGNEDHVSLLPAAHSLPAPLADTKIIGHYGDYKFGSHKGPTRRVRLSRRVLLFSARPGDEVRSMASGKVRYVGPISGLGQAMIIDHQSYWVVLGHLADCRYALGDTMAAGAHLASAKGESVYLELRLARGEIGQVVDPEPLLSLSR